MYRIGKEEVDAIWEVIKTRKFFKTETDLKMVDSVEKKLKEITGADYAIMMTSGMGALISGLVGLGIGPGDEVIVPAYTYIATAMAVLAAGAIPVLAEIDESCTIDPADVEKKITPATKAIIPVHIQGFPCDMDALCAIAKKHNIKIIEDACQADGGSYKGKRLGSIGDCGAFSFNYYKIVSAGEGGALITSDRKIFERALIYHDSNAVAYFGDQLNGIKEDVFGGTEFRANEISAAVMNVQLTRLDGILADLRRNKKLLMDTIGSRRKFIPSADIAGDCGTTLAMTFATEKEARDYAAAAPVKAWLPYDTGKHVYKNWTFVLNKKGASHPAMDPFLMPENKGLRFNYTTDMCPKTLDVLSRTVYIAVDPDMSEKEVIELAKKL